MYTLSCIYAALLYVVADKRSVDYFGAGRGTTQGGVATFNDIVLSGRKLASLWKK